VGFRGRKLDGAQLSLAASFRVKMDRSNSMRRFFAPFVPGSHVEVTGTRSGKGPDEIDKLRCPLPSSLPAGWEDNDVSEFDENAPLEEIPVIVRAKVKKAGQ
jgi:hypothetical protein